VEKLRAALLDIRQKHVMSEQDCGDERDQQAVERHMLISEQLFGRMQKELNECIRHHQDIKRYDHT
jgi:septum formation topological specificity factor MinE